MIRRQVRSRSLTGWCGHDCFELNRGQSAKRVVLAASVVGPFDPGEDRDPEFVSGPPGPPVEDILHDLPLMPHWSRATSSGPSVDVRAAS